MADEKSVFLYSRPGTNSPPSESNFGVKTIEPRRCEDNSVLAKTLFLSVDPYMRCRLNEDSGVNYLTSWKIGETVPGGGVGLVLESKSSEFKEGDIVQCFHWPWQTNAVFTKGSESWTSLSKVSNCSEFVCVLYKHAGKRVYFQFSSELRIQSGLRDAEHHQLMYKRDVFQNISFRRSFEHVDRIPHSELWLLVLLAEFDKCLPPIISWHIFHIYIFFLRHTLVQAGSLIDFVPVVTYLVNLVWAIPAADSSLGWGMSLKNA